MMKRINLPAVIGFETAERAEDFCDAAGVIIPKLKVEDLDTVDGEANQRLFLFYTRKDTNYRELKEEYKKHVKEEKTNLAGWTETSNV